MGINIAQVFVCGGIARMRVDRQFQRGARFVVVSLACIEYGEVVIWLGQFRIIFRKAGENLDRVGAAFLFGIDQALEKACLCILRLQYQRRVDFCQCEIVFALLVKARGLFGIFRRTGKCAGQSAHCQEENDGGAGDV